MSYALAQSLVDPRLPTLQAVLDPYELGQYLRQVLPTEWGTVQDIQTQVLQHHRASRCTLEIALQTTTGTRELIGKLYATDRSDVYRAMEEIKKAGFGSEAEFSISQPLAFIPELQLLLQEKVHGPLVTEIFLTGSEGERIAAAERCASWLAHFHILAPMAAPVFLLTHEILEHWMSRLAKRAGPQAEQLMNKAAVLFERLETAAVKLDGPETCGCHGTYCHYQIILTKSQTVTLDWDGFCVAHPSLDLARFTIVLQQLALKTEGSLRAFDTASEAFYETYAAEGRFDFARTLPIYKAAHCLKHAKHHLKPGNGGLEMAQIMLDEGLRILAEEV
jgi:aminoglycoside phosphotransferase (APT) family kinase protein